MSDLNALRELAEKAEGWEPFDWLAYRDGMGYGPYPLTEEIMDAGVLTDEDAAFIAACSPDRILALLDNLQAAEWVIEAARDLLRDGPRRTTWVATWDDWLVRLDHYDGKVASLPARRA